MSAAALRATAPESEPAAGGWLCLSGADNGPDGGPESVDNGTGEKRKKQPRRMMKE